MSDRDLPGSWNFPKLVNIRECQMESQNRYGDCKRIKDTACGPVGHFGLSSNPHSNSTKDPEFDLLQHHPHLVQSSEVYQHHPICHHLHANCRHFSAESRFVDRGLCECADWFRLGLQYCLWR